MPLPPRPHRLAKNSMFERKLALDTSIVDIITIAQVVQTAVAPVFLLTGVAALLGVLSNRLGRVVDRARVLERRLSRAEPNDLKQHMEKELNKLWRRARLINRSFSLITLCALMICVVVVALFLSHIMQVNLSTTISLVFILAMLLLIGGLLGFLREIYIATNNMRAGLEFVDVTLDDD